jgi:hypothetical protein
MKTLRQLCVALTFTLALTVTAFAGEIHTTVVPPPPAPVATATDGQIETTVTGQEETGGSEATATDSAAEIALNLLQSVLSLF